MRAHALTHKRAHPYPYRLFFFLIIAFNQLISVFLFFSLSFNLVLFFFFFVLSLFYYIACARWTLHNVMSR